jgi:hypothetical protein
MCENELDPTARVVALWGSPGYGRSVRILGHPVRGNARSGLKQRSPGSFPGRPSPFIAGLSADVMIAPWVIKGAMPLGRLPCNRLSVTDGVAFAAYIEKVLVPELSPGTVVLLPSHRCKQRLPGNGQPRHAQERRSGKGDA